MAVSRKADDTTLRVSLGAIVPRQPVDRDKALLRFSVSHYFCYVGTLKRRFIGNRHEPFLHEHTQRDQLQVRIYFLGESILALPVSNYCAFPLIPAIRSSPIGIHDTAFGHPPRPVDRGGQRKLQW